MGRPRLPAAFSRPIRVINDAAMQALGSYGGARCRIWAWAQDSIRRWILGAGIADSGFRNLVDYVGHADSLSTFLKTEGAEAPSASSTGIRTTTPCSRL
jgi:hypothetical protein